jgi:hypothetical protein
MEELRTEIAHLQGLNRESQIQIQNLEGERVRLEVLIYIYIYVCIYIHVYLHKYTSKIQNLEGERVR